MSKQRNPLAIEKELAEAVDMRLQDWRSHRENDPLSPASPLKDLTIRLPLSGNKSRQTEAIMQIAAACLEIAGTPTKVVLDPNLPNCVRCLDLGDLDIALIQSIANLIAWNVKAGTANFEIQDKGRKLEILDALPIEGPRETMDLEYLLEPEMNIVPNLIQRAARAMVQHDLPFHLDDAELLVKRRMGSLHELLAPHAVELLKRAFGREMAVSPEMIEMLAVDAAKIEALLELINKKLGKNAKREMNRMISEAVLKGMPVEQIVRTVMARIGLTIQIAALKAEGEAINDNQVEFVISGMIRKKAATLSGRPTSAVNHLLIIIGNYIDYYVNEAGDHIDFETMCREAQPSLVAELVYQYGPLLVGQKNLLSAIFVKGAVRHPEIESIKPANIAKTLEDPVKIVNVFLSFAVYGYMLGASSSDHSSIM